MTLSTDSNSTERLISPIQTLAKSNKITFWTRRRSCHPSSRDPVRISPALSLPTFTASTLLLLCHCFKNTSHIWHLPAFFKCECSMSVICSFFFFFLLYSERQCCENEYLTSSIQSIPFTCKSLDLVYYVHDCSCLSHQACFESSKWLESHFTTKKRRMLREQYPDAAIFDSSLAQTKKDLENEKSEDQWSKILKTIHSSSICVRHGLHQFKIVHWLHTSKVELSTIFPAGH